MSCSDNCEVTSRFDESDDCDEDAICDSAVKDLFRDSLDLRNLNFVHQS
jgi:hypothetical protein